MAEVDAQALQDLQSVHSSEAGKKITTDEELAEAKDVLSLRAKIFKKMEVEKVDFAKYPSAAEFKLDVTTPSTIDTDSSPSSSDDEEDKEKKDEKKEVKTAEKPKPLPSTQNTFGDFHAHTIKMIYGYITTGTLELKNGEEDYKRLLEIHSTFTTTALDDDKKAEAEKFLADFAAILRHATWNKKNSLRRLGDILADSGGKGDWTNPGNDALTIILERILKEKGIVRHTLSSNHDDFFFHYYWKNNLSNNEKDDLYSGYYEIHPTLLAFRAFWQKWPKYQKELKDDFEDNYLLNIKAIDYVHDTENNALVLFTHAPNGLETVAALAKLYHVTYQDSTTAELKKTIDQINKKYAYDVQSGDLVKKIDKEIAALKKQGIYPGDGPIPIEFPLVRLIWNRARQIVNKDTRERVFNTTFADHALNTPYSLKDKTKLFFCHDHDGANRYRHLRYNMINLDNHAGKNDGPQNDCYLQTTGICAPFPPNQRRQIRAINALFDIVTKSTEYYSDTFLSTLRQIKKIVAYDELDEKEINYAINFLEFVTHQLAHPPTDEDAVNSVSKLSKEQENNCPNHALKQAIEKFGSEFRLELQFRCNPYQKFKQALSYAETADNSPIDESLKYEMQLLFKPLETKPGHCKNFHKQAFYALYQLPTKLRVPADETNITEQNLAKQLTSKINLNHFNKAVEKKREPVIGNQSEQFYKKLLQELPGLVTKDTKDDFSFLFVKFTEALKAGPVITWKLRNYITPELKKSSPQLHTLLKKINHENYLRRYLLWIKQQIHRDLGLMALYNEFLSKFDQARKTLSEGAQKRITDILSQLVQRNMIIKACYLNQLMVEVELDNLRYELEQKKPSNTYTNLTEETYALYQKQKKLYEAGTKVYTEGRKMADYLVTRDDDNKKMPLLLDALVASKNLIKETTNDNVIALVAAAKQAPNESVAWYLFCGTLLLLASAGCIVGGILGFPFSGGSSLYFGYAAGGTFGAVGLGFFARAFHRHNAFSKADDELASAANNMQLPHLQVKV